MERRSSTRGKGATQAEPVAVANPKKTPAPAAATGKAQPATPAAAPAPSIGTRSASTTKKAPVAPPSPVKATPTPKDTKEKKGPAPKTPAEPVVKDAEVASSSKSVAKPKPTPAPLPIVPIPIRELKQEVIAPVIPMDESEAPEPVGEDVILNRRGMPQRQRKRNRLYFDDDMVTSDTPPARKTMAKAKIKDEPVEEMVRSPSPVFQHAEPPPSPVKRTPAKKKIFSPHPTAVQVAQAVTQMVKPKIGSVGRPSNAEKYRAQSTKIPKDPLSLTPSRKSQTAAEPGPSRAYARTPGRSPAKSKPSHAGMGRPKDVVIKTDPDDLSHLYGLEQPGENSFVLKIRDAPPENMERKVKERQYRDKEVQKRGPRARRMSSPQESLMTTPIEVMVESEQPSLDKKTAQGISLRLRNLLKLPKAHKWVCYEWFYSNIDKVLFEGENDFQICFKESFPQLKTRKLTRVEWTKLRRLMGKPRRCSYAFFDEEREELARRRQKIRMIQQRKVTDFNYKELPDEIPLQLVIGTKVTTRLRRPQDGLFTGTIEAVDTSNNTYRITFERPGLGTHSIPDYEVLSNELPETVSTSSFALKIPRRSYFTGNQFKLNAALGDELNKYAKSPFPVDGMLGGFPIRLLDMIVRLSKLLKAKREKILQLKELNVEAEKMKSYNKPYNDDFRTRYARCVLDLESQNKEMNVYLEGVQQYCLEIAPDHGANQMVIPQQVKEQCDQEAALIVNTYNARQNRDVVSSPRALMLVARLASTLLQAKALSTGDRNLFELKSIKDSLKEIKASLDGRNLQTFQDKVEIPMNRIQAGLTYSHSGSN